MENVIHKPGRTVMISQQFRLLYRVLCLSSSQYHDYLLYPCKWWLCCDGSYKEMVNHLPELPKTVKKTFRYLNLSNLSQGCDACQANFLPSCLCWLFCNGGIYKNLWPTDFCLFTANIHQQCKRNSLRPLF